jgi:hypothetical protein
MNSKPATPPKGPVLFCPFCRECFEGLASCPDHDLTLVEFARLPPTEPRRALSWDEPMAPWDPRSGRLEVVVGVLAVLGGFLGLPLVSGSFDDREVAWTALEMASGPARNLWVIPVAAALFGVVLARRRTPLQLRAARLAGLALALAPLFSLGYSIWKVSRAVDGQFGAVYLRPSIGAWVVGAGCLAWLIGSVRFGGAGETGRGARDPR